MAQKTIYGGSYNLLAHTLPQYGIQTIFVDAHDLSAVTAAIQPNTKATYPEILGNLRMIRSGPTTWFRLTAQTETLAPYNAKLSAQVLRPVLTPGTMPHNVCSESAMFTPV